MTSNNFNEYYHVSSGTKRRDRSNLSRRNFLGVVSAIGAGAFLSGHSLDAWSAAGIQDASIFIITSSRIFIMPSRGRTTWASTRINGAWRKT